MPQGRIEYSRTGTVSTGILATFTTSLKTLLGNTLLARTKKFSDFQFKNTGDRQLLIAVFDEGFTGTPVAADFFPVDPGQEYALGQIFTESMFVATADIAGSNSFAFICRPYAA